MRTYCGQCGEELLGAVNRCWKCGRAFAADVAASQQPPVRRPPLDLDRVKRARLGELTDEECSEAAEPAGNAVALVAAEENGAGGKSSTPARRGSPFASGVVLAAARAEAGRAGKVARSVSPAARLVASAGAFASILLALLGAAIFPVFPSGAAVLAFCGLIAAVWGFYSRHRLIALVGLLICGGLLVGSVLQLGKEMREWSDQQLLLEEDPSLYEEVPQ